MMHLDECFSLGTHTTLNFSEQGCVFFAKRCDLFFENFPFEKWALGYKLLCGNVLLPSFTFLNVFNGVCPHQANFS